MSYIALAVVELNCSGLGAFPSDPATISRVTVAVSEHHERLFSLLSSGC